MCWVLGHNEGWWWAAGMWWWMCASGVLCAHAVVSVVRVEVVLDLPFFSPGGRLGMDDDGVAAIARGCGGDDWVHGRCAGW